MLRFSILASIHNPLILCTSSTPRSIPRRVPTRSFSRQYEPLTVRGRIQLYLSLYLEILFRDKLPKKHPKENPKRRLKDLPKVIQPQKRTALRGVKVDYTSKLTGISQRSS